MIHLKNAENKMADIPQISENTKLTLDVKTIGLIISFTVGLATTYFTLKSEIALAMEMPKPEISSVEFKYKDELIRSNVEKVIEQVDNIEKDVEEIKAMMKTLDARLYEIQSRR
jgi:hypothetical protein